MCLEELRLWIGETNVTTSSPILRYSRVSVIPSWLSVRTHAAFLCEVFEVFRQEGRRTRIHRRGLSSGSPDAPKQAFVHRKKHLIKAWSKGPRTNENWYRRRRAGEPLRSSATSAICPLRHCKAKEENAQIKKSSYTIRVTYFPIQSDRATRHTNCKQPVFGYILLHCLANRKQTVLLAQ